MPFTRPPRTQLINLANQDIAAGLGDTLLPVANTSVLGLILAEFSNLHYGYLDRISKESVPFTCSDQTLEAWAAFKRVTRIPAAIASGTVSFSGTSGAILPAGSAVARSDGTLYRTLADATVGANSTLNVSVQALNPGASGNTPAGVPMILGNAVSGIMAQGVAVLITGGSDAERDDDLRDRMLAAFAAPAQGGAKNDYLTWARAVPGVTRAWCKPGGAGAGTVVVYVMFDGAEAGQGGFPQGSNGVAALEYRAAPATGDQLTVANALFPVQPATALVFVCAPIPSPVNFTIQGLTQAGAVVQSAVSSAIADVILREGSPGGVILDDGTPGGILYLSHIETAIAAVPGVSHFVIQSPTSDLSVGTGQLPVLGTVTWA